MAISKGKIVLSPPPTLMQLAAQNPAPPKKTRAQLDAEYRRQLGVAAGERLPSKLGGGSVTGNDAARGTARKRQPRKKTTPKQRTTCLRCHRPGPDGKPLEMGYCPKCWNLK